MADSYENLEILQDIGNKIKDEYSNFTTLNIVIIGKTGVGKSTLINTIFGQKLAETGIGKPVTQAIRKIEKKDIPLVLYDTPGMELKGDNTAQNLLDDVVDLINNGTETGDVNQAIHCVWYCINASSGRIEPTEIQFLRDLAIKTKYCNVPLVVILTKSILKENVKQIKEEIEKENLPIKKIIPVLSENFPTDGGMEIKAHGIEQLAWEMNDILPDYVKATFISIQDASIALKQEKARIVIKSTVITVMAIGGLPIPTSDAPLIMTAQMDMIAKITAAFGLRNEKEKYMTIIYAILGTTGATSAGKKIVSNIFKMIPGVGTIAGGAISAATAATLTTALGETYIVILGQIAKGKISLADLSTKKVKREMQHEFKDQMKKASKLAI